MLYIHLILTTEDEIIYFSQKYNTKLDVIFNLVIVVLWWTLIKYMLVPRKKNEKCAYTNGLYSIDYETILLHFTTINDWNDNKKQVFN